jgi:hypothetical protein
MQQSWDSVALALALQRSEADPLESEIRDSATIDALERKDLSTLQQIMHEYLSQSPLATPNEMGVTGTPDPRVNETYL